MWGRGKRNLPGRWGVTRLSGKTLAVEEKIGHGYLLEKKKPEKSCA